MLSVTLQFEICPNLYIPLIILCMKDEVLWSAAQTNTHSLYFRLAYKVIEAYMPDLCASGA